ncbi:MAG: 2-polyprenyl-6-methoxyphenol hydroxylase, partial [Burkholderiales bacterium]|nr:2-polyprenyl-6-methoxyphenol hydroxylase [Burkholderiales bacterium]
LDLFGQGCVLLRFGAAAPPVDGLVDAAAQRGVPLRVVDIEHEQAQQLYQRRLVLVRPDGQSCWRADAEPADALAVIDAVRGALPAASDGA